MSEFFRDKEINLVLKSLEISYYNYDKISNGEAEFINKISPKMLKFESIKWTVKNIKTLGFLNCTNIDAYFNYDGIWNIHIWLINTPIQLFDSKSDQIITFKWRSIDLLFEKIKLWKAYTDNFLFIPLKAISHIISYSGFREILNADDINWRSADFSAENQLKNNGVIIPMRCLNKIFIELNDSELDYLNQMGDINKMFKEKHINLTIKNLGKLLEINTE